MAQKAIYHNAEGLKDVTVEVLKTNRDGTVDLGNAEGELLIGRCKTNENGRPGSCTILAEAKSEPKSEPKAKETKGDKSDKTEK